MVRGDGAQTGTPQGPLCNGFTHGLCLTPPHYYTSTARRELYIPSELAYGERGAGRDIPGGAALIFTLEMITVKGKSKNL